MDKDTQISNAHIRTIIFCVVIVLNLIAGALSLGFILFHMRFPTFTDLIYSSTVIGGFFSPSILCFSLLQGYSTVQKKRGRMLLEAFVVIITITVFSMFFVVLSLILCPLKSSTKNPKNYMVLDKIALPYTKDLNQLFPEKIPESAENIEYCYEFKTGVVGDYVEIEASWDLPEEEYLSIKESVESNPLFENAEDSMWQLNLEPPNTTPLDQFIVFNKEDLNITYLAIIDK